MWQPYSYQLQYVAANAADIQSKFGSAFNVEIVLPTGLRRLDDIQNTL
jgi:hypothetical protein